MRGWVLSLALILATSAVAAEPVRLARPMSASALPRIAAPLTPQAAKINAALTRLDQRWASYARECRKSGKDNTATRSVKVTMAGLRFLSLVASDEETCGGAHPDNSTLALVYDLGSGRPVDWRVLLGPRLATATRLDTVIDGSKIGTAGSPELSRLYQRALRKAPGFDPAWWTECAEVLQDPDLQYVLWPDAKTRGLVALPVVVHAVAPCAEDATIPAGELKQAGADAGFVAALGG